jgi:hypothetical protein
MRYALFLRFPSYFARAVEDNQGDYVLVCHTMQDIAFFHRSPRMIQYKTHQSSLKKEKKRPREEPAHPSGEIPGPALPADTEKRHFSGPIFQLVFQEQAPRCHLELGRGQEEGWDNK